MDKEGGLTATRVYEEKIKDAEIVGGELLILTENEIRRYDTSLNELSAENTDKGYVRTVRIDAGILLMSGNTIDLKKV